MTICKKLAVNVSYEYAFEDSFTAKDSGQSKVNESTVFCA